MEKNWYIKLCLEYFHFKEIFIAEGEFRDGVNTTPTLQRTLTFILYYPVEHIPHCQQVCISMPRKNLTAPHLSFHTPIGIVYS